MKMKNQRIPNWCFFFSMCSNIMSCGTIVAGINLQSCIYNASGPRTGSVEALLKIANSKSGAVLSKSATLVKQDGNTLPRFVNKISLGSEYCEGSINSEGLPNLGIDYYIDSNAINQVAATGKPYIVSISGLSMDDNITMLERIYKSEGISAIELNLACPNVPGKPMIAYDFEQMEAALSRVCSLPQFGKIPLGVKLAPYFDTPHFEKVAAILVKFPIKFIVCINTIGNGLVVDGENECEGMAARSGHGGMGGGFVKHTALANVRQFCKLLQQLGREDIDIIGVGGVHKGMDAFELILCGAKAVQVGTCHWTEGPGCFDRITNELLDVMKKKGYESIEDFRGKLKSYVKPARKEKKEVEGGVSAATESKDSVNQKVPDVLHTVLMAIIAVLASVIVYLIQEIQAYRN